jgi:choline dehydrogenase-like flavoprotein
VKLVAARLDAAGAEVRSMIDREHPWPWGPAGPAQQLLHSWGCHHMGTTRMGSDPAIAVVDGQCRVHGTTNLYVAGSSVFPTGGFANPTFTIVALAIRLADQLRADR